ncbi:MAG: hypothetical protein U1F63_01145 [Chitinivorax sp.]
MDSASQLISNYRHFQLLRAALEIGLFEWLLEHGPASHADIANAMRLHKQRSHSFLVELATLNWLKFDGTRYTPSMQACQLIGAMTPATQAGKALLGMGNPYSGWNRMSELLLTLDTDNCASAGPASEAWPLPLDGTGCDPVQAGNAPGRFYA